MGNTAKLMLVGVLALVIVIAVIWDRQSNDLQTTVVGAASDDSQEAPAPAMTSENSEVSGQITLSEPTSAQVENAANDYMAEFLNASAQQQVNAAPEEAQAVLAQPQADEPAVRTYIVKELESFWTIARDQCGDATLCDKLAEANKERVPDPRKLRAGTTLIIPKFENARVPLSNEPAHDAVAANGKRTYTVEQGDCLGIISQKFYGTSKKWQLILDANNLEDERNLRAGMKIVIPPDRN